MTLYFPILIDREDSGTWSAWVAGLPVYAQGATSGRARASLRATLKAYLDAHPDARPTTTVEVAAVDPQAANPRVALVSPAALLGRRSSARKAAAARLNGRLGGRPRVAARA